MNPSSSTIRYARPGCGPRRVGRSRRCTVPWPQARAGVRSAEPHTGHSRQAAELAEWHQRQRR
ncbi:hypothetical protein ACFQ2M_01180 [Kitasatospora saccharophila]|uniref:hypothetical protein n=1 Tax=Kitasatospora saccharophila TaxID=407973 RepID=UPI0036274FCC